MQLPRLANAHPLVSPPLAQNNVISETDTDAPQVLLKDAGVTRSNNAQPTSGNLQAIHQKLPSFDDVFTKAEGGLPEESAQGEPHDAHTPPAEAKPQSVPPSKERQTSSTVQVAPANAGTKRAIDPDHASPLPAKTIDDSEIATPAIRFDPNLQRGFDTQGTNETANIGPASKLPLLSQRNTPTQKLPHAATDTPAVHATLHSPNAPEPNSGLDLTRSDRAASPAQGTAFVEKPLNGQGPIVEQHRPLPFSVQEGSQARTASTHVLPPAFSSAGTTTPTRPTMAHNPGIPDVAQMQAEPTSPLIETENDPRWIERQTPGQTNPRSMDKSIVTNRQPDQQGQTIARPDPTTPSVPTVQGTAFVQPDTAARIIETADQERVASNAKTALADHALPATAIPSAMNRSPNGIASQEMPKTVQVPTPLQTAVLAPRAADHSTHLMPVNTAPETPTPMQTASTVPSPPQAFSQMQSAQSVQTSSTQPVAEGASALVVRADHAQPQPLPNSVGLTLQQSQSHHRADRFQNTPPLSKTGAGAPTAKAPWGAPAAKPLTMDWASQFSQGPVDRPLPERSAEPFFTPARIEGSALQPASPTMAQRSDLPPQTLRQIAEAINHMPGRPVEITLSPEELGRLRMTVRVSETGVVVNLLAERPETLDLLRRHIDQLGSDFQAMGFEDIAFSFGDDDTPAHSDSHEPEHASPLFKETADDIETNQIALNSGATSGLDLRL